MSSINYHDLAVALARQRASSGQDTQHAYELLHQAYGLLHRAYALIQAIGVSEPWPEDEARWLRETQAFLGEK